jgi:hypothetical protein
MLAADDPATSCSVLITGGSDERCDTADLVLADRRPQGQGR